MSARSNSSFLHRSSLPRRAFTLVELLVVIGIIALLVSLLVPVVMNAMRGGERARLTGQMQAIATALEAYKTDFNGYPVTTADVFPSQAPAAPVAGDASSYDNKINANGLRGARVLAKALVGPAQRVNTSGTNTRFDEDGEDNAGFRVPDRTGTHPTRTPAGVALPNPLGKVYGPYLTGAYGTVSNSDSTGGLASGTPFDDTAVLVDATGKPVLYFPQNTGNLKNVNTDNIPNSTDGLGGLICDSSGTVVPQGGLFDINDNKLYINSDAALATRNLGRLLGDKNTSTSPPFTTSGHIGAGETLRTPTAPYLLWFAGPDRNFGIALGSEDNTAQTKIDDVTNIAP